MIRSSIPGIADSLVAVPDAVPAKVETLPAVVLAGKKSPLPSLAQESLRTLRTNLLLRCGEHDQTIVLTSARPGEGKTTISANLARSLTGIGKRVLLIDADLRRPAVHRFFGISNARGLVDVLKGAATPEQVWQEIKRGPTVLTSGPVLGDPQTLFQSEQFARLMNDVRRQFDVVLVDSPPLLAVADTALMLRHVDGVVLVLKYAHVSETDASRALDRISAARGKVIGCVLSQVSETDDMFHSYASDYVKPE